MAVSNFRTYYGVHSVSIGPNGYLGGTGAASGTAVHGLQSANTTTTFSLDNVFELGQLDIYAQVEALPNIEMTLNKVIDGYPLVYHMSTPTAPSNSLVARSNIQSDVILSVFSDSQSAASGVPLVQMYCSGMYVNSLNYSIPVNGNVTEAVTLVGNDKLWISSSFLFNGQFNNADSPLTNIMRRQNVVLGYASGGASQFPTLIPGMTTVSGVGYNYPNGSNETVHLQDINITCNLGREDIFELGHKRPYFRYARFPIAVDTTINVVNAGTLPGDMVNALAEATNLQYETINIYLSDGTNFNMGSLNKCQSVTMTGGDTGGGIVTTTYSFQNFNDLVIHQAQDPAGF